MNKIILTVIIITLIIAFLYFIGPHIGDILGWFITKITDLLGWFLNQVWSLLWISISFIWSVVKFVTSIFLELYTSLLRAYPLISIACFGVCFGVIYALRRLLSRRINPIWMFVLAPVIATIIGDFLFGGGSMKLDITITDTGLIIAAVCVVFGLYYGLLKSKKLPPLADSKDTVSKILNYSFIVVLVLMIGGFGIAAIDEVMASTVKHTPI